MLKGYEVKERLADGRVYAVVELEDGTTFGQLVSNAVTVEQLDSAINEAVARVTKQDAPSEIDELVGQYRLMRQE